MALVLQVFGDRQLQVEAARLKDDADLLAHLVRLARNIEALNGSATAGWGHQRRQDAEEGGFPAAIGAQQAEDLRSAKLEAEVIEGEALSIAVGQALEHDRGEHDRRSRGHWSIRDCRCCRRLTECSHGHLPDALSIIAVSSSGR
jgi:hypothetical protein